MAGGESRRGAGHRFVDRIRETIRRYHMFAGGETGVIAASGGPDSTALLRGLAALGPELNLTLHVAHFNHGLRPDAGLDAAFVAEMCRALRLEFHQDAADARAFAAREGRSVEDAARRLRYAFLTRVAWDTGAAAVVTGHTLDDQAETVLIRLLRGSGLDGLTGIPPVRGGAGPRIVRPLIEITRGEVEAYLRAIESDWREDSTNRDLAILRNRIRLVLIPALEGYNPDVRQMLARAAGLLRDEAEAVEMLGASRIAEVLSGQAPVVGVALEPFAQLPVALQRRALREAVRRLRGNLHAVRFVHIEGARQLVLAGRAGSWLALPGGGRVTRLAAGAEVAVESTNRVSSVYTLVVPGRLVAVEFGVHLAAEELAPEQLGADARPGTGRRDVLTLDAALVGGGLVLRGPLPGDRFAPAGMGGRTKMVADYLRDEKVPLHRRAAVPILTTADGVILWVVGLRASEIAQLTSATTRAVRITARPLNA